MHEISESRYCPYCRRRVLALWQSAPIFPHVLMTLLTCGCWFPILCIKALYGRNYRCSRCGTLI